MNKRQFLFLLPAIVGIFILSVVVGTVVYVIAKDPSVAECAR